MLVPKKKGWKRCCVCQNANLRFKIGNKNYTGNKTISQPRFKTALTNEVDKKIMFFSV